MTMTMTNTSKLEEYAQAHAPVYHDSDGYIIDPIPASREEAKEIGSPVFIAAPCKWGHQLRYASNGQCVGCKKAHNRAWKAANPEKVRAYQSRWQKANPDKVGEYCRRWQKANGERCAAHTAKVDATRRAPGSIPYDFDFDQTVELYAERDRLTAETGIPHEVDHAVGLAIGGEHLASNLRVVSREENRRKGVIERQLILAAQDPEYRIRLRTVWRDFRDELVELVGPTLADDIHVHALQLAQRTEAERVAQVRAKAKEAVFA